MMQTNHTEALVIIDAERCFMPAEEGERLELPGFGELPVAGGEAIVPRLNQLTHTFRGRTLPIAYTLDKHHIPTAHFSDQPNYVDTWPIHAVEGTPGSLPHPDLFVAQYETVGTPFYKGQESAKTPADDTSYTGALGRNPETNELLPDWLKDFHVGPVYIGGLALGDGAEHKLCVDSTAFDFKRLGFEVAVISDAVEAVLPENRGICFERFGEIGIRLLTAAQAIQEIKTGQRSN